ncbi:hypothetical protein L4D00_23385 [Photobacterium swingsii]|uniref:hypothetical protein n=1 Tax=Photobacterium swingsii TaxID=680026 RepID=UPI003D11D100
MKINQIKLIKLLDNFGKLEINSIVDKKKSKRTVKLTRYDELSIDNVKKFLPEYVTTNKHQKAKIRVNALNEILPNASCYFHATKEDFTIDIAYSPEITIMAIHCKGNVHDKVSYGYFRKSSDGTVFISSLYCISGLKIQLKHLLKEAQG